MQPNQQPQPVQMPQAAPAAPQMPPQPQPAPVQPQAAPQPMPAQTQPMQQPMRQAPMQQRQAAPAPARQNNPNSSQASLLISELRDSMVIMKDGSFRAVVACKSINFDLMSEEEREAVEFSYQNFLNSLSFTTQILIRRYCSLYRSPHGTPPPKRQYAPWRPNG